MNRGLICQVAIVILYTSIALVLTLPAPLSMSMKVIGMGGGPAGFSLIRYLIVNK
ncbi:MAG TPA: hypothetical protein VJB68_06830 [Methylophilaceae bacterium]|nr:hypothetical protein [Methylophilaceae bacterium]